MKETLGMCGLAAIPGVLLVVHRAGLLHSIRVCGNVFYSAAVGLEAFRRELRRLNEERRGMK